MLALSGCTAADGQAEASSAPIPSPTASLVPPPGADPDAEDGPVEPEVLPTQNAELGESIAFETGVEVEITDVEAITVEAETPGEISGPAVVVEVSAVNDSTQAQSFDSAVVTVVADDGALGIGTTAGDPSPLAGIVEPGSHTSGRYVFMLDPAAGRQVTVTLNYAAGEPVAIFTGKVS